MAQSRPARRFGLAYANLRGHYWLICLRRWCRCVPWRSAKFASHPDSVWALFTHQACHAGQCLAPLATLGTVGTLVRLGRAIWWDQLLHPSSFLPDLPPHPCRPPA